MSRYRPLERPDFEDWIRDRSFWVSTNWLSKQCKNDLFAILPKRWDWKIKARVMYEVNKSAQIATFIPLGEGGKYLRDKHLDLAKKSRELLKFIKRLRGDAARHLHAFANELKVEEPSPLHDQTLRTLGDDFAIWWDVIEDIEAIANYAASRISISRQSSPKKDAAKGLIYACAVAVWNATGKLPPISKGYWFVDFMKVMGEAIHLTCGAALVNGVGREMVDSGRYRKTTPIAVSLGDLVALGLPNTPPFDSSNF